MISVVIVDSDENEADEIEKIIKYVIAKKFDNELKIKKLKSGKEFESLAKGRPVIDMLIFEVEGKIKYLEDYREKQSESILMLLASDKTSPMYYLNPRIQADSLIVRPCEKEKLKSRILDLIIFGLGKRKNDKKLFTIRCMEGVTRIPIEEILYFEAREKKIFARTLNEEYGFYGTLSKLSGELPENFIRCHKGFIVNINKTISFQLSKGEILLESNTIVPLSRSYRVDFREKFEGM